MGEVYWAVGKLRVLEQNPSQWNELIDSLHSYIWTAEFNFITAFYKKNAFPWSLSVSR